MHSLVDWRKDLRQISKRASESLASPSDNSFFPEMKNALAVEEILRSTLYGGVASAPPGALAAYASAVSIPSILCICAYVPANDMRCPRSLVRVPSFACLTLSLFLSCSPLAFPYLSSCRVSPLCFSLSTLRIADGRGGRRAVGVQAGWSRRDHCSVCKDG